MSGRGVTYGNAILLAQALAFLPVSRVIKAKPLLGCQEDKMEGVGSGAVSGSQLSQLLQNTGAPYPTQETLATLTTIHTAQVLLVGPGRWNPARSPARRNRGKLGTQLHERAPVWQERGSGCYPAVVLSESVDQIQPS